MTSQVLGVDLREIVLANSTFGPQEISQLSKAISDDPGAFSTLRDAVGELEVREDRTPASAVRLGVCYYLMGRYRQAIETLSSADGGALAHFYLGRSHFALGNHPAAMNSYKAAKTAGYNGDDCALATCEAFRYEKKPAEALQVLDHLSGAVESTAEYLYQRAATVAALGNNPMEMIALYERAVEAQPNHPGALFGLGLENDRRGNDERALQLYLRATAAFPPHLGSLMNLGLLYEDRGQTEKAAHCYLRILEVFPDHPRARMFLKDASGSGDTFYDEEAERRTDRMTHVLSVPVSDFELSVRSRNCLQKMGVRTLGDLCRITEHDLLQSKNFGETSLVEIRDMLASKGLELGQFAYEKGTAEPAFDLGTVSPDEQQIMDRPIADLNLSVRARKCMVRLGMGTLGDLIRKTGDDLLECKNFGVTSLNEVREKLTELGLKLRGE